MAIALLLAFCLLWPAPHLSRLQPPNELVRLYATRALVDDHTVAIDEQVRRYGRLADSASRDGHLYSDKAPGLSLLATPVYAAARGVVGAETLSNAGWLRLLRSTVIVIPTCLWVWVLGIWLLDLGLDRRLATTLQLGYVLATPAFAYCLKFVGHQAAAWMVGIALACAWWGRGGKARYRALAGLGAGLAAITEYPTAPLLALIAAYTLVRAPRPWRGLFWFGLGAALPLTAGALYHTAAYGGPLTTGYSFVLNPAFRGIHSSGLMGVGLPRPTALIALTVGSQRGLLVLSPWLLLAVVGLRELRSRHRFLVALLAANVLGLLWVATGFGYWLGGWAVGPRHLVSAVPALAVLAGLGWQRLNQHWPSLETVWRAALVVGCVACGATALTLPGFPEELLAPLFEQALPLVARLQFSYSLGTTLGLGSTAGMVPVLVVSVCLMGWSATGLVVPRRLSRRHLWQTGLVLWLALGFFLAMAALAPQPSPEAVFRVAWLTQTMWEPKDDDRLLDPRPAAWEAAHRAVTRARPQPNHFVALGAVEAYRGEAFAALRHYLLSAHGFRQDQKVRPEIK